MDDAVRTCHRKRIPGLPEIFSRVVDQGYADRRARQREGITLEEVEKEAGKFIPNGLSTEGHHIMHIVDSEDAVGTIW